MSVSPADNMRAVMVDNADELLTGACEHDCLACWTHSARATARKAAVLHSVISVSLPLV